jgi:tricorn protease
MVTLMNYASASDGDQFPFFFRKFGLGQLVGDRTWGGVQGINQPWRLANGDFILIPKDSLASEGQWVIENAGVAPDISTSAAPDEGLTGADAQLDAATTALLKTLAAHPTSTPLAPPSMPAYPPAGQVPPAKFGPAVDGAASTGRSSRSTGDRSLSAQ